METAKAGFKATVNAFIGVTYLGLRVLLYML